MVAAYESSRVERPVQVLEPVEKALGQRPGPVPDLPNVAGAGAGTQNLRSRALHLGRRGLDELSVLGDPAANVLVVVIEVVVTAIVHVAPLLVPLTDAVEGQPFAAKVGRRHVLAELDGALADGRVEGIGQLGLVLAPRDVK